MLKVKFNVSKFKKSRQYYNTNQKEYDENYF